MMKKTFCMFFLAAAVPAAFAYRTSDVSLGGEWLFHMGDVAGGEAVSADTSGWERVKVPHDWAIGKAFDMNYPAVKNVRLAVGNIFVERQDRIISIFLHTLFTPQVSCIT